MSGMFFSGARFSNYEALNEDVGGGVTAIRITSLTETELFATAIGALLGSLLMVWAGWFHFHQSVPTGSWFNNVDSLLNHHLTGLLGCG